MRRLICCCLTGEGVQASALPPLWYPIKFVSLPLHSAVCIMNWPFLEKHLNFTICYGMHTLLVACLISLPSTSCLVNYVPCVSGDVKLVSTVFFCPTNYLVWCTACSLIMSLIEQWPPLPPSAVVSCNNVIPGRDVVVCCRFLCSPMALLTIPGNIPLNTPTCTSFAGMRGKAALSLYRTRLPYSI